MDVTNCRKTIRSVRKMGKTRLEIHIQIQADSAIILLFFYPKTGDFKFHMKVTNKNMYSSLLTQNRMLHIGNKIHVHSKYY